jgi:hypothetical protein
MTPRTTCTHALLLLAVASSMARPALGVYTYEPPEETDVTSSLCQIGDNGFFGTLGFPDVVSFNYEIELKAPTDSDTTFRDQESAQSRLLAVSAVEKAIADFVLGTNVFDNACSTRRRRQLQVSIRGRRLNAVGISSSTREDRILEDSKFFFLGYLEVTTFCIICVAELLTFFHSYVCHTTSGWQ